MRTPGHQQQIVIMVLAGILACGSRAKGEVRVEAVRINGSVVAGVWMPSAEADQVVIRTPIRQEILSVDDLLRLRPADQAAKPPSSDWPVLVKCRDGTILPAEVLDGDAAQVVLRTPFAERIDLEIDRLLEVHWLPDKPPCRTEDKSIADHSPGKDKLLVIQTDDLRTLEGTLESLSPSGGKFRFRDRTLEFDAASTCALLLASAGGAKPAAVICVMNESYQLAGRIEAATGDAVLLRGVAGATLTLPLAELHELQFNSDRIVYLSDMKPSEVRQQSFFDVPWPTRLDLAVSNRTMSMKGRRYRKGIGTHSASEITYQLDGEHVSFAATIGIDDRVRPAGHVVFRVLADGKELFNSGPVRGTDDPRDIDVRLAGARTIRLLVDPGDELDLGDHANWAEARLIRR